jgi:hypothetical protein
MFPFPQAAAEDSRARALRWLYRRFTRENAPEARGLTLLKRWLSDEQRAQFEANEYFDVIGCHSGRRYRIHHGTAANVIELDETGARTTGWCFMPAGGLVAGDIMLAQKIALESNERGALAVAQEFSGPFFARVYS